MEPRAGLAEYLFQQGAEGFGVVGVGVVEPVHKGACAAQYIAEIGVRGMIHLAGEHLSPFFDERAVFIVRGGGQEVGLMHGSVRALTGKWHRQDIG